MTTSALKLNLSSWLLFASLACFAITLFFLWQRSTPVTLTFSNFPQTSNSFVADSPVVPNSLTISELGIESLPVIPGQITNGRWPVSPKGVIHLSNTPQPGQPGNSIIYGHNWPNLLSPLKNAQTGQIIKITDHQGDIKIFQIDKISIVSPDQTELLATTEKPVLTIYTCTGFLDTLRLVISASLISGQN